MKSLLLVIAMSFVLASDANAGRANAFRVFVQDVQCTTLESSPPQYEGIARVVFTNGFVTRMRFERGTNADILATCQELRGARGSLVTAIYNFDLTPPENMPSRIIHGFVHLSHSHIVNGTVYGTRSLTPGSAEIEEDFSRE